MKNLLKSHPSISNEQALKDLCSPLNLFNISSFANARINHKGEFSTICNHPSYLLHYLEKNYHQADISSKNSSPENQNYLMWDMLECYGKTADMLSDAASFNYRHIFTIVKKEAEHTDYYHFGTHLNSPSINQWYLNNLDKLELFIHYFNEKMSQFKTFSRGHEITFPVAQTNECQILGLESLSQNDQQFIHQISLTNRLSLRQQQCLELAVQGYSAKKIANHLNISHRTVSYARIWCMGKIN